MSPDAPFFFLGTPVANLVRLASGYAANDPENPLNWSLFRRLWVSAAIRYYTFAIYIGGGLISPAYRDIEKSFDVNEETTVLTMSLFIFAYGFGALFFSPLSEIPRFGRNPWYWGPTIIVAGMQLGAALSPSFAGLAICRFLTGFFGSSIIGGSGASFADIWGLRRLPIALRLWSVPAFFAPGLGPIIVVSAVQRWGWRWSMWIHFFIICLALLLLVFTVPETSADSILYHRAARLRSRTGDSRYKARSELKSASQSPRDILYEALAMPFKITLLDPSILFASCYLAYCYGLFFTFFESYPIVFNEIFGFNPTTSSAGFVSVVVGTMISYPIYVAYQLFYMDPLIAKHGMPAPEKRLEPALISCMTATVALFIFECIFYYIIVLYEHNAASVLAANDFMRSTLTALLIHAATPLFRSRVGIHGGVSLLGGLAALGIVGAWWLYLKGGELRKKSRFAVSGAVGEPTVGVNEPR
ncbi:hypothetical protein JCM8097_008571 [Rhodosporidiobolus ruineniae]